MKQNYPNTLLLYISNESSPELTQTIESARSSNLRLDSQIKELEDQIQELTDESLSNDSLEPSKACTDFILKSLRDEVLA